MLRNRQKERESERESERNAYITRLTNIDPVNDRPQSDTRWLQLFIGTTRHTSSAHKFISSSTIMCYECLFKGPTIIAWTATSIGLVYRAVAYYYMSLAWLSLEAKFCLETNKT